MGLAESKESKGSEMTQRLPDGEWVEIVTEKISASLKSAACASYENGCALLDDARVLNAASRFPRASALAILAEEEFSKAFIVCSAVQQKRWDSNLFRGLRDHAPKQAVAQGMLNYWEWAKQNSQRVADMNSRSVIQCTPSYIPDETLLSEMLGDLKRSHIKKRQRDKEKQNYFYVGIDRNGNVDNDPGPTSKETAIAEIEHAIEFRKIAEHMLAHTLADFIPLGESKL